MILIAGCNGHVGRELVKKTAERKITARCFDITPCDVSAYDPKLFEVMTGDITDPESVRRAIQGVDAVLFVIGRRRGTKHLTHDMIEHGGIKNVVQAAHNAGVRHILYISALGVGSDVPATSLQAKWNAEQCLIRCGIPYTIFRPSGYFVDFAEEFAPKIKQTGTFTIIGDGTSRVQPLDPADLAEAFMQALERPAAQNKIIKIAGPETFTLVEIIELVGRVVGRPVKVKKIPVWLGKMIFSAMALISGNKSIKDFLYRMTRDSVCTEEELRELREIFSIEFKRLEPWLRERVGAT
ncbi:MAG: NAD(P)H-binding protein [Desulfobacterota bacterium]|nr:NAD(P)H-binding protein [Thermodesulfobacteriota bacterium]